MSKLDISESQGKILDKIFDRGHDVLYSGVGTPLVPNYILPNEQYVGLIDSPPPLVSAATIEATTKSGSRVAAAAIVAHVTPSIYVLRAANTSVITLAGPQTVVTASKTFNSKSRKILFMFNGFATATGVATLNITPRLDTAIVDNPFSFSVPIAGSYIYGSWEITLPDTETVNIGLYASTNSITEIITLDSSANQVVTIYG